MRYICMQIHSVSKALAAHVTAPLSSGRAARSGRKSQLRYFLFGSVARLPGNSVWTQTAWNGTTTNSLLPFQPFQPGRMKLRHILSAIYHNYLGRYSSGAAFSLSYVSRYVRTTHYLTCNHRIGQFVPYVLNSYSRGPSIRRWCAEAL